MQRDRVFLDTAFVQALLNRRDQDHPQAVRLLPRISTAPEVWVTECVLLEVANALSALDRRAAVSFIDGCYQAPNMRVVGMDSTLLARGLRLYRERDDKAWSLTDCISFVVMADQDITDAATADRHFVQAGFRALMLERE